jgi:hydroxymethylbilane synthase
MTVTALVAMPDGSESIRDAVEGPVHDAEQLGVDLANRLLASGAGELLAAVSASNG